MIHTKVNSNNIEFCVAGWCWVGNIKNFERIFIKEKENSFGIFAVPYRTQVLRCYRWCTRASQAKYVLLEISSHPTHLGKFPINSHLQVHHRQKLIQGRPHYWSGQRSLGSFRKWDHGWCNGDGLVEN